MMATDGLREALALEAGRIEEDALYSSRGHFQAALIWGRIHLWVGLPIAVLAAIGGAVGLKSHPVPAAMIAAAVAALTAGATFLNPSGRSQSHHTSGVRFNSLRNQVRIFREVDLRTDISIGDLTEKLRIHAAKRDELNEASPQIPRWGFVRARKSIEAGEAAYAVDSPNAPKHLET